MLDQPVVLLVHNSGLFLNAALSLSPSLCIRAALSFPLSLSQLLLTVITQGASNPLTKRETFSGDMLTSPVVTAPLSTGPLTGVRFLMFLNRILETPDIGGRGLVASITRILIEINCLSTPSLLTVTSFHHLRECKTRALGKGGCNPLGSRTQNTTPEGRSTAVLR